MASLLAFENHPDHQAVIFDMDGVLIDSEWMWAAAEKQVFAGLGIDISPAMASYTQALTTTAVTAHWYRYQPWIGPSLAQVEGAVIDRVRGLVQQHGRAMEGVEDALRTLSARGTPLGLASNSPRTVIHTVLDTLSLTQYFDCILSADEVKAGKPAPDIYLKASQSLSVPPQRCLVFEDSDSGAQAARAAGMSVVMV